MAGQSRPDERQADLFGWIAPLPASRPPRRTKQPSPEVASPTAEPITAAGFAAQANAFDLDELVTALDDERLAHLALVSARQLRRRLSRTNTTRSRSRSAGGRRGPLDRAGAELAAEWATPPEEAW